jgi:hypothetical protein
MTTTAPEATSLLPPLTDSVITAVSRLLDDHKSPRDPSHSDLKTQIKRADLTHADPTTPCGKEKRIRAVLGWAIEHDERPGRRLVGLLISEIRGCGGFRADSENYVGAEPIENARVAFRVEGFDLASDGVLLPVAFDGLTGREATAALRSYARRAIRGADDPLVVGTSKDLLEATAAHVVTERFGGYSHHDNFPTLLGQAFVALDLATSAHAEQPDEPASRRVERSLYDLACAINGLRNRDGVGHGRPWLPLVTSSEARGSIRAMGVVSDLLLDRLNCSASL